LERKKRITIIKTEILQYISGGREKPFAGLPWDWLLPLAKFDDRGGEKERRGKRTTAKKKKKQRRWPRAGRTLCMSESSS